MNKFYLILAIILTILVMIISSFVTRDGLWCYLDANKKSLEKEFHRYSNTDELVVNKTIYHFDDDVCIVIQTEDKKIVDESIKKFKKYKWGYRGIDKSGINYYCVKINGVYYLWHDGELNYKFSFLKKYQD